MLAPHAVDIAVTISSLTASLHVCFTFAESFDDIFLFVKSSCALVSGNTNKSLRPKDRPTDRPSEWIRARSLNSYFAFCKIVVKISAQEESGTIVAGYSAVAPLFFLGCTILRVTTVLSAKYLVIFVIFWHCHLQRILAILLEGPIKL